MSGMSSDGTLVPAEQRGLAQTAAVNPLVARALADLAQNCGPAAKTAKECERKGLSSCAKELLADIESRKADCLLRAKRLRDWLQQNEEPQADSLRNLKLFGVAFRNAYKSRCRSWNDDVLAVLRLQLSAFAAGILEGRRRLKEGRWGAEQLLHESRISGCLERGIAWSRKKEYDQAIVEFDETIRLIPNNGACYYLRGMARYLKQDYDRAIKDFDDAIRLDPNKFVYECRGKAWLMKKDFDRAIKDYNQAIRLEPNDAFLLGDRGEIWCLREDYDKAIDEFNQAIRLDPESGRYYLARSQAWCFKKEFDKAMSDCNEAILAVPEFSQAYVGRGTAWLGMQEYDTALKDFDEAIRLDIENADAYGWFAWTSAMCSTESSRDGKRAIQLAMKACELTDWKRGWQLDTLAATCAKSGQFEEAERYETKALEDPDYSGPEGDHFRQNLELYKQKKLFRQRT